MANILKFNNIYYPLYGLAHKPQKLIYTRYKISAKLYDGTENTIDDKNIKGDYFTRLLNMKSRLTFDFTCRNLQDVLFSKTKWGMDSNAIPHDLSKLQQVKSDIKRVERVENNIVWVKNISYPFTLNTTERVEIIDDIYARLILVNNEWFLQELLYDKEISKKTVWV